MRGIAAPMEVFGVHADGLAPIEPHPPARDVRRTNLPLAATEYVGQHAELAALRAELERSRLVTLPGTGGVGKTRMAVETAWLALDDFAYGAWLAELAPVGDPDAVVASVAALFRVQAQGR